MNRKKIAWLALVLCLTAALVACGGGTNTTPGETPGNKTFTGITFADKTVTYDGTEHSLTAAGVPAGAQVVYTNNAGTNAGTYAATAVVSQEGYETLTLRAVLTIAKAQFTGITFADKTVVATGKEYRIEIESAGELPQGTTVTYTDNTGTKAGVYEATAVVAHPNYETMTLTATLTINELTTAAKDIVAKLLSRPDPWAFMPEALRPAEMAYTTSPIRDFSAGFVNVTAIADKPIGKQMYVMYDGLTSAASLLGKADIVFAAGSAIADVYQTYINKNPDDYASFTGEAAGFRLKIELNGGRSTLLAGNSVISAELHYDAATAARKGRIQLTDGAALYYESSADRLKFAYKLTVLGVGTMKQIEFERNDGVVTGTLYTHTGKDSLAATTAAVLSADAERTVILSAKRESDDLLINGYGEVYDSRTGKLMGGEVEETVKVLDYDTFWFNLYDVTGFTSVKAVRNGTGVTDVGKNRHDIFVNGADSVFATVRGGIGGLGSRKYDIEMKQVWYAVDSGDGPELVETEIPMLFVQNKYDSFGADVKKHNAGQFSAAPVLPAAKQATVAREYTTWKKEYDKVKETVGYQDILDFIGDKDSFFTMAA